ncbi:glycosyltransferase [Vibrio metoecus]|uniref:glycosyltransferase n=1 Tax=Vibrio metoecus TaxID=1481663 RepID=UPI0006D7968F|nr:glycosyltransferase [Vibrio metoecus]KQA18131.1 hypothetical protein AAY52_12205 [Vibrio metoecus]
MKVIFRISRLGFGGAEQVFISLAKELALKYSFDIHFIVDSIIGENSQKVQELGFKLYSLEVKRNLYSIFKLAKLIDEIQPDIIISAYTDTNAACLISGCLAQHKAKIIVTEHASLHEHWRSKSVFKIFILKFYVKKIYRLASKVVCVSNGLANQVKELMGRDSSIKTIYNPVRKIDCIESVEKDKNFINLLAVGRISKPKDYLTVIKAVLKIKEKYRVRLNIVGGVFDRIEFDNIALFIKENDLQSEINFIGYTDYLGKYYKSADVFVMCSAWEGFGNVLVEALSFGLPIVSTDCNFGPREILEDGIHGVLVPVGDFNMLAEAIIKQYIKPAHNRIELIKRSEFFSESEIAKKYYSLINEVIYEK